ncbi:MAG: hypothetical protein ACHQ6T_02385 [Myxococcota bacterium]
MIDPATGRAAPVVIELRGEVIRIAPMLESPKVEVAVSELALDDRGAAFAAVVARMRRALTLEQIEEIAAAVESEVRRAGDIDPPV